MEALLSVAVDAGHQQPYPQTHAFNVLTALYQDKVLSADISPFVAQGLPEFAHHCYSPHSSPTALQTQRKF